MLSWPDYVRLPWAEWSRRRELPDVVYVDGRFRVACCLSVALATAGCAAPGGHPLVMLHDVSEHRPYYGEVFDFFETVDAVNTLRVLRAKPGVAASRVLPRLLEYQFDYR